MSDGFRPIPEVARREISRKALIPIGGLTVLASVLFVFLEALGQPDVARGLLLGHILAQGVTVTWVGGALLTWNSSHGAFLVGTVGLFPVRLLVILGAVLIGERIGWDLAGIVLSLVITQAAGHAVEAFVFRALADASSSEPS